MSFWQIVLLFGLMMPWERPGIPGRIPGQNVERSCTIFFFWNRLLEEDKTSRWSVSQEDCLWKHTSKCFPAPFKQRLCVVLDDICLMTEENECLKTPCHKNANCTNTAGSFRCQCYHGYMGNGKVCTGEETHKRVRTHTRARARAHTQTLTLSHTCTHTHTHTHTHTRKRAHTHNNFKVARNEVKNASFAQRSAHRDSRIWRPELIEPAAERKRRARGRRPTFKSAYPDPQILPQCNISSNHPL